MFHYIKLIWHRRFKGDGNKNLAIKVCYKYKRKTIN